MNGLREALPLLHGLGANSPFWFGDDSGMASSRAAVIRAYPGRGHPAGAALLGRVPRGARRASRAGGGPTDHTMVWWDARPQPRLGTVELRELDVQTEPRVGRARIAALARAIVAPRGRRRRRRAGAGAGAALVELPGRTRRPRRRDLLRRSVRAAARGGRASAGGAARRDDPELEGIERILREGNGADRQRAAYERGGMPGLLRYLAERRPRGQRVGQTLELCVRPLRAALPRRRPAPGGAGRGPRAGARARSRARAGGPSREAPAAARGPGRSAG